MTTAGAQTVLAFDLYGTLLDTSSVAAAVRTHFPAEQAAAVVQDWRKLQLEYTWRLNSMGAFALFVVAYPTFLASNHCPALANNTSPRAQALTPTLRPSRARRSSTRHTTPAPRRCPPPRSTS